MLLAQYCYIRRLLSPFYVSPRSPWGSIFKKPYRTLPYSNLLPIWTGASSEEAEERGCGGAGVRRGRGAGVLLEKRGSRKEERGKILSFLFSLFYASLFMPLITSAPHHLCPSSPLPLITSAPHHLCSESSESRRRAPLRQKLRISEK